MAKKEFQFNDTQTKAMAIFIAELTRQGVTYEVRQMIGGWAIKLTGGF